MTGAEELSGWDAQLKFTAILPDFQNCLRRMGKASAEVSPPRHRIDYGEGPRQWVDLHEGTGPAETAVLFFHGGYWRALDAGTHRFVLPGFAGLGATLANAEYRLMPAVRMGDLIEDAVAAARAVLAETGAHRLLVAGHSAGAHLALSALRAPDVRVAAIGAVLVSGVYDLAPVRASFLQEELTLSPAEVDAHSFDDIPADVPILLLTGGEETGVFRSQAHALAAMSDNAFAADILGAHHMNVLFSLAAPDTPVAQGIADWLRTGAFPDTIEGSIP